MSKGEALKENIVYFITEKEERGRYRKAFTGVIKESKSTMSLKHIFHKEGLFAIRLTILGLNLCILKDLVCEEVESFVQDQKPWLEKWFNTIRQWQSEDVDAERFLWLRVRGIPCHAWSESFLTSVVKVKSTYIKCDEKTMTRSSMEEARVCIKSGWKEVINLTVKAIIDGEPFFINLIEDPSLAEELKTVRRSRDEDGMEEHVTSEWNS